MKYVELQINDESVEIEDLNALPISIDYQLEDSDNFQQKKGNQSFDITVPATLINDKIFNTYHNPSVEDLTTGQIFKNHRACRILGNGFELLNGKAFLIEATHDRKPIDYKINCYGGNADWMIDLKETTLYEVFKNDSFIFSKANIIASWNYDGTNYDEFYVFAPVKYGLWLDIVNKNDNNFDINSMKASLSVYWTLYRGFRLAGYKMQSEFFDTTLFRRLVMPWTWGNFLDVSGEKYNVHKFRAKGTTFWANANTLAIQAIDVAASNDFLDGMFDNNNTIAGGDYTWIPGNNYELQWKYNTPHYGPLEVTFSAILDTYLECTYNSSGDFYAYWYKNGVLQTIDHFAHMQAPFIGGTPRLEKLIEIFYTIVVNPGDEISLRIFAKDFCSKTGVSNQYIRLMQFQLDYFRIPVGGTVAFDGFESFKKYKFLDCLRGVIDAFNLSVTTDNVNKVVYLEPTHFNKYSKGFFKDDFIDWTGKQDLGKKSTLELFSDYDREVVFKFKNDTNDGILKLIQDRHQNELASGKYVFPDRFKAGKKEFENRFFSPVMHYDAEQFKQIDGMAPQLVVIVPENISNTSRSESQNTFSPKLCFYKGIVSGQGGWRFDGDDLTDYPFMFAVNYKTGGIYDPILSYSDERIGAPDQEELGTGLLKTFFWQRLAIMRNGQYYTTFMQLENIDVAKHSHREYKILNNQKWELVQINDFKPMQSTSTKCMLRKYAPVTKEDFKFTYPSSASVLTNVLGADKFDIKYAQLKCVISQIPTPE
jgi:hypothetical protein